MNIVFNVSDLACASIITSALHGGIGYWAQVGNIKHDIGYKSMKLCEMDAAGEFDWKQAAKDGRIFTLNYTAIRSGIRKILSGSVKVRKDLRAQVLSANDEDVVDIDSDAADCIVQAALLHEIRYG